MVNQGSGTPTWEQSLLRVISEELGQLRFLIEDQADDTELPDVHAQISRLSGLTDLVYADDLKLSRETRTSIEELANRAEELVRGKITLLQPGSERVQEVEHKAAQQMYDAILLNLPYLTQGDKSQHAIALSKKAFSFLHQYVGNQADFEMVKQVVLIQDYRIMKLAGSS